MITEIETYFSKGCGRCERFGTVDCSTQKWGAGLVALRALCREAGLSETVKWGHPCYMYADRNIVVFGAFRTDLRLTFFNASLLKDSEGVLQKQGPNAQHPSAMMFTDNAQVGKMRATILAYINEAKSYAVGGIRPEKVAREIELPNEMYEALDSDPELAEAFHVLTPGRQKSYAFALNSTQNPATRFARIAKFRAKIIAGKGALDR